MMKKLINILFIVFILFFSNACQKVLDKKPLDVITDKQVWNDPNLVNAYVANLYSRSELNGLFTSNVRASALQMVLSDEGRRNYDFWSELIPRGLLDASGTELAYWDYSLIRDMNSFLIQVETANVTDNVKEQYIGQVKFLRAYAYFEMVKRYGGVPLIVQPQDINELDALFVPRNTEKEIYDFIAAECDAAAGILPESYPAESLGRASKYAALALKSKAMLYAASEAKYGEVQLNGLVGIPASDADAYWQKSLDASKAIIDAGIFHLFNNYPDDKSKNYQMIFLEKNNAEIILAKKFVSVQAGHEVDDYYETNANYSYWGCMFAPSLELVNSFEMKDGSSGFIDFANTKGDLPEILKNKDPRCDASILYNGQPWVKDTVRIWLGVYAGGVLYNSEAQQFNGVDQVGRDQKTSQASKTGFLMKKFLDPNRQYPKPFESDQDWIVYRYAEILLNYAEASFELGHTSDALNAINEIRERAGIQDLTSVTIDKIRHERRIELVFENNRFWDLKRWRTAEQVLNTELHGAYPYYLYDENKFSFQVLNCDGFTRIFKPAYYYLPITIGRINNNPKLVENPGY